MRTQCVHRYVQGIARGVAEAVLEWRDESCFLEVLVDQILNAVVSLLIRE